MRRGVARAVVTTLLLIMLRGVAHAQGPPNEAESLLEEGTRLYADSADLDAARKRFEASYELRPSWQALNGIALVYTDAGRTVDAIETYGRLLHEFGANLKPEQLATVQRRIAQLRDQVVVVRIEANQPGVTVRVDGDVLGEGPLDAQIYLMPGRHVVSAELAGHVPLRRVIEGAAGRVHEFSLALSPEPANATSREAPPAKAVHLSDARTEQPTRRRWLGPGVVGLGGASVVAGTGVLISSSRDYERFDRRVRRDASGVPMPIQVDTAIRDRADTKRVTGFTLLAAGVALGAAGVVIILRSEKAPGDRAGRPTLSLAPMPRGAQLHGAF